MAAGLVVAYEADAIDPRNRSGWSVIVTGVTRLVTDRDDVVRYRQTLSPWVSETMDHVIRIHAKFVTGYLLVGGSDEGVMGQTV